MSLPGGGAILVVSGSRNGAGGAFGVVVTPPSERTAVATAVRTTAGSLFAQVPMKVMSDGVTRIGIGQHRIVGFDGTGG